METALPTFRYHPDPIATGSVQSDDTSVCGCCQQRRGFVYTGPIYGARHLRNKLCPWCIATGKCASNFNCSFVDDDPLERARVPRAVILEVTRKTPGYSTWQQDVWATCCGDACVFYGEASKSDLLELTGAPLARQLRSWQWRDQQWHDFVATYEPRKFAWVFSFQCQHCKEAHFALDVP